MILTRNITSDKCLKRNATKANSRKHFDLCAIQNFHEEKTGMKLTN